MQSSQAPSRHIIYRQNVLANIIISVLLPYSHFVLFLLDAIYFVNDLNKMYCLHCTGALKRCIVLYSIILLGKIYSKDIIRDRGKYFFKNVHHSAIYNGKIVKAI